MPIAQWPLMPLTLALGLVTAVAINTPAGGPLAVGFAAATESDHDRDQNSGKGERHRTTEVSVSRLTRLSPRELEDFADRAFNQRRDHEPVTVITGFSESMSGWILRGASVKPRIFRRLLRELAGERDRDKRLEILNEEKNRLQQEIEARQRGVGDLDQRIDNESNRDVRRQLNDARNEERRELERAQVALESVNTWIAHPEEGTSR